MLTSKMSKKLMSTFFYTMLTAQPQVVVDSQVHAKVWLGQVRFTLTSDVNMKATLW
jgi:hypothetical protein